MAEEESVDLWGVVEEAAETVEGWPEWRQRYDPDVTHDEAATQCGAAESEL
jgi:hypothetical protein